jgi:hypothetical protein
MPINKGKAAPLQAWSGPEGSRKLRYPDFLTTSQEVGKVVRLTHRQHLYYKGKADPLQAWSVPEGSSKIRYQISWQFHRMVVRLSALRTGRICITKGKAVPLQAWSGPEGSRKLRFPYFVTISQDGGKVISLTYRPHLPQEILLVLISVGGWVDPRAYSAMRRNMSMKNSNDNIWDRISDLKICSPVP